MKWFWIRIREGLRWLFRGSQFTKLERDILVMSQPFVLGELHGRALVRRHQRLKYAFSWLPPERSERFHEMMARYGHPTKEI